jgi:tRNA-specific 2-thiouridylase
MSGGVDSSVCAYLLKKQGYDVIGVFMQNWDSYVNNDILGHSIKSIGKCDPQKDFEDAQKIADQLKIKLYKTQFINRYWDKVFNYLLSEYQKGNTPNPDILCNKYIKFNEFIKYAKCKFNCNLIAMGHYANVFHKNDKFYLTKSKSQEKDQTYFLCWLNQQQLSKVIFPIGKYTKKDVRNIAKKNNLVNWNKKDSTGICFIGERDFRKFLTNYLPIKKGAVIDIDTGTKIGEHDGVTFYTIGQNKGLGLSGQTKKYFVCKKDIAKNVLFVCEKSLTKKYLTSNKCFVRKFNWINKTDKIVGHVDIRFRHRQNVIKGSYKINKNVVELEYNDTLSVTVGQFAVLYKKNVCLGGGIITKIWKN